MIYNQLHSNIDCYAVKYFEILLKFAQTQIYDIMNLKFDLEDTMKQNPLVLSHFLHSTGMRNHMNFSPSCISLYYIPFIRNLYIGIREFNLIQFRYYLALYSAVASLIKIPRFLSYCQAHLILNHKYGMNIV